MKRTFSLPAVALSIAFVSITNSVAQWSRQISGTYLSLRDVAVLDSLTAVCVGDSGRILKTTNAGLTWSTKHKGVQRWNALAFVDSEKGFVVGNRGAMAQTSDRGESWSSILQDGGTNLVAIAVIGMRSIYVVADNGTLLVSHDAGMTWSVQSAPSMQTIWMFGKRGPLPVPLYGLTPTLPFTSTDLGLTWHPLPLHNPLWVTLERGTLAPNGTAFVVGSDGNPGPLPALFRRLPTDTSWSQFVFMPPIPPCIVRDVDAPTNERAYACATDGWMFQTIDAGSFWTMHPSPVRRNLHALAFISEQRGFAVGDSGTILFTSNGASFMYSTPNEFSLLLPTNGDTLVLPRSILFAWNRSVDPDSQALAYTLILSSNGGDTWFDLGTTADTALQVQNTHLFGSGTYVWAVIASDGQASTPSREMFTFVIRDVLRVDDRNMPSNFALHQNYPNPCSMQTAITFQLPTRDRAGQSVELRVFDVLGREIAIVLHERMSPGEHTQTFDAHTLPSGVYFYQLKYGSSTATRRMFILR